MSIFIAILKTLLILSCIGFIMLILLLLIPLSYNFYIRINEVPKLKLNISLIYKLVSFQLVISEYKTKIDLFLINKPIIIKPNKSHNKEPRYKKYRSVSKNAIGEYLNKEFLSYTMSYISDITNMLKPCYVSIEGIYGFEDPSTTGTISAIVSIIEKIFTRSIINLEPCFSSILFNIQIDIQGEVVPFSIVWITLKFLLKKDVRKRFFKKSKTTETY